MTDYGLIMEVPYFSEQPEASFLEPQSAPRPQLVYLDSAKRVHLTVHVLEKNLLVSVQEGATLGFLARKIG